MENKGADKSIIKIDGFDERHGKIKELLTCPLCKELLKDVTSIDECLHIFCRSCIENKIIEENLQNCPICNIDLGVYPFQKLKPDYYWQSIRNNIKFRRQKLIKTRQINEKFKKRDEQVPEEASYKEPEVNSLPELLPIMLKEKSISSDLSAEKLLSKARCRKQTVKPSKEDDKNATILVPSGSRRSTSTRRPVTEDLNVPARVFLESSNCFRMNQIWFSLVASNKQKSYLPLPSILPHYLMVKDPNASASYIKKYLVNKLRLHSEDEVELNLRGQCISSDCPLHKVVDLWQQTTSESEKKEGIVGSSGQNFVTIITYCRRNRFF